MHNILLAFTVMTTSSFLCHALSVFNSTGNTLSDTTLQRGSEIIGIYFQPTHDIQLKVGLTRRYCDKIFPRADVTRIPIQCCSCRTFSFFGQQYLISGLTNTLIC